MKIAVISDLHIGHSDETHQLGHSDHDFANFLFELEKRYDKIILLGDIFEVEMEIVNSEEDTYKMSVQEHHAITKRFNSDKYIYVFGNHDCIAKKFGAVEHYQLRYKGRNYLFVHGHQFDRLYQAVKPRIALRGGLCLLLRLKMLYRWTSESLPTVRRENELFQRTAIEYGSDTNYDFVITGHTHEPMIIEGDVTYINSGTCTYGRICYVHMDLDKEEYLIKSTMPFTRTSIIPV